MMTKQNPAAAPALLDPLAVRVNRETIRAAVVGALTCVISGIVLDMRSAVAVTVLRGETPIGSQVYAAHVWDGQHGRTVRASIAERPHLSLAVLDGREWFATDAQRAVLAVVDAHASVEVARSTNPAEPTVGRAAARALVALGLLAEFVEDGTNYVNRPVLDDPAPEVAPANATTATTEGN